MASKKQEPVAPVVTSLPLPSSDSVLVIDLPDGQKLLVGKMEHGTVIEVATWRGTGRPDSRTNRLMLGMSNGDVENADTQNSSTDDTEYDKRSIKYWIWISKLALNKMKDLVLAQIKKFKERNAKAPEEIRNLDVQADVDAWLESIIAKGESKQKTESDLAKAKAPTLKKHPKAPNSAAKKKNSTKKRTTSKKS